MGGIKPPKDWLQKQKSKFVKTVIVVDMIVIGVYTYCIYCFLKGYLK